MIRSSESDYTQANLRALKFMSVLLVYPSLQPCVVHNVNFYRVPEFEPMPRLLLPPPPQPHRERLQPKALNTWPGPEKHAVLRVNRHRA